MQFSQTEHAHVSGTQMKNQINKKNVAEYY